MIVSIFQSNISIFRSDNGGEFVSNCFKEFLYDNGVRHELTCPHTPEQNGVAERKHRHIVETVRTLLSHAHLPYKFWLDAALAAVHVINRLPCSGRDSLPPFQRLYKRRPSYTHLRVFGCDCFPWQVPQRAHKLAPNAPRCTFLGYSDRQKGFKCYHLATGKMIISRHVRFHEDEFSFHAPLTVHTRPASPILNPQLLLPSNSTIQPSHNTPISSTIRPPPPNPIITPPSLPAAAEPLPNPPPLIGRTHGMQTRSQTGHSQPRRILNLTTTTSPLADPLSYKQAAQFPHWQEAMQREISALMEQRTWSLVSPPPGHPVLGCKWTYRTKYNPDGSVACHKARLVAQGFSQIPGVDYNDTFSPVVRHSTIRVFLSLAVQQQWHLQQLDISNAFLHGQLAETVFIQQPKGFVNSADPQAVCRLHKTLYGLKQSPRAWNSTLTSFLRSLGYTASSADPSLYLRLSPAARTYVIIYVDDILIGGNSSSDIAQLIADLSHKFKVKLLGEPHTFLGIRLSRSSAGCFLSQANYASSILSLAGMESCKPVATPVASSVTVTAHQSEAFANPKLYRQLAGSLQYLTITRPDIAFTTNQICQFMHNPTNRHYQLITRVLRYIQGTKEFGLPLRAGSLDLHTFSDSDWAGDPLDRKSTTGYCMFLGPNLVAWKVQKQATVARSSTEAEYRALAASVTELIWLRRLLHDFGIQLPTPLPVHCDNTSTIAIANNPIFRARTKHIEIDFHFIRDHISNGDIRIDHIPSSLQRADILTKGLPKKTFADLRAKLSIQLPYHQLAGGY